MQCEDFKKLLSQFLDNQLEKKEQNEMQGHLQTCVRCKSELESLSKMINLMREIKKINPPHDFMEKVNRRLDEDSLWQKITQHLSLPWPIHIPVRLVTALATIVLAIYVTTQVKTISFMEKSTKAGYKKSIVQSPRAQEKTMLPSASTFSDERMKLELNKKENALLEKQLTKPSKKSVSDLKCDGFVCRTAGSKVKTELEVVQPLQKDKPVPIVEKQEKKAYLDKDEKSTQTALEELKKAEQSGLKKIVLSGQEKIFLEEIGQDWVLEPVNWQDGRKVLEKLLAEFEAVNLKRAKYSEAKKRGLIFNFKIRYGYLSTFYSRLKEIGRIEALTAFPIPRPGVYVGMQGGCINPRILEELIPIKLTFRR